MVKIKLSAGGHFNRPEVPFREALAQAAQERGFTQEELAHRAHLHRNYVGGVERGERNISLLNIVDLAQALSVRPAELLKDLS